MAVTGHPPDGFLRFLARFFRDAPANRRVFNWVQVQ